MKVYYFCPHWGSKDIPFTEFAGKVKEDGYDGVEMGFGIDGDAHDDMLKVLKDNGLALIAQHAERTREDFSIYKINFEKRLYNLTETNPLFINSQTGRDHFTFEQNCELIEIARNISNDTGVQILHETHRGKFTFCAHITKKYLMAFDDLRLGLDISHWCNVAESLLEDQSEAVDLAISRADHIHARIGFPEGPQIPDPRVPEWNDAIQTHLGWWDRIIKRSRDERRKFFTITSEFGPFPYMQMHPQTKQPLANQWELNVYMKDLLSSRYYL